MDKLQKIKCINNNLFLIYLQTQSFLSEQIFMIVDFYWLNFTVQLSMSTMNSHFTD